MPQVSRQRCCEEAPTPEISTFEKEWDIFCVERSINYKIVHTLQRHRIHERRNTNTNKLTNMWTTLRRIHTAIWSLDTNTINVFRSTKMLRCHSNAYKSYHPWVKAGYTRYKIRLQHLIFLRAPNYLLNGPILSSSSGTNCVPIELHVHSNYVVLEP